MNRNLNERLNANGIKTLKEPDIDKYIKEKHLNTSAKANIAVIRFLKERIKIIEKEILAQARLKPEFEKLLTVPGIGKSLALTIMLETGNIARFKTVGDYASYCRCVPSKRISNDKSKGQNNRKNGNKFLAWAFVEAANFAQRYSPQAELFYKRKYFKKLKVVAIKALAHKIARACYYIMRDNVNFEADKLFNRPISLNKGCSSEPEKGLRHNPKAPIGQTAAAAQ
jgi:transposase